MYNNFGKVMSGLNKRYMLRLFGRSPVGFWDRVLARGSLHIATASTCSNLFGDLLFHVLNLSFPHCQKIVRTQIVPITRFTKQRPNKEI